MLNNKLHLNKDIFTKEVEKKSTRQGYGDALEELGETNPEVVVLCADLKDSTKATKFAQKFPERFIEMGIAEQNMASVAAGMALSGKTPFISSYAIFNPGRNWEQIRLSICYTNANVKIIGNGAGLSHNYDGGMAQCLEDIALTRVLPRMIVLSPIDYNETKKAVFFATKHKGPVYIRLCKAETPVITTPATPFDINKAQILMAGSEVTLIATGPMAYEALLAAKELKGKYKIEAEVISCTSIKPLDNETILNSAKKTGLVVTIEDHQIIGGLGSAVAEVLSENQPTKIIRIGVHDKFGESGTYQELKDKYGLSYEQITDKVVGELKNGKN